MPAALQIQRQDIGTEQPRIALALLDIRGVGGGLYPAGGFTAEMVGGGEIKAIIPVGSQYNVAGSLITANTQRPAINPVTGLLQLFSAGGSELANNTNIANFAPFPCLIVF